MNGYSWVSGISIFCYLFLLISFIASKKKERVIRSFITLLILMIFWTGGSVGMRLLLWPSPIFWHHVSLLGILMLPFGYYQFLLDFLDENHGFPRQIVFVVFALLFLINCFTGLFIPEPEVIMEGGQARFLYHYDFKVYLLIIFIAPTLGLMIAQVWRHCRGNRIAFQQLKPVIIGILIVFLGNIVSTLPFFVGLPVDMLSGAVNAVFLFYALYKKKLFRISILLSKTNYGIVATILGLVIFSEMAVNIRRSMTQRFGLSEIPMMVIMTVFLIVLIGLLYFVIRSVFDLIYTRPEQKKKMLISRFSEEITHMMNVSEILQLLSDAIEELVDVSRLFVLVRGLDGNYQIEHTINPLDEKNFYFRKDHPLVSYLQKQNRYVFFQDFSRKTVYRSMWESEKALLVNQQIECFVPFTGEEGLIGFILLSGKPGKSLSDSHNLDFVQELSNLCTPALNNAYLYERTIKETQKDDLTGLVNIKYFYEILDQEFEKNKDSALSLCLIDVDDFKLYNQMYGSREGDNALQRVANILASSISETCYAARIEGDRFALVLPGYDIYSAKCLADNIAEQISRIRVSETAGKVTVSIGICAAPYMASSAKELYRNADSTVYTVKRTGKNAVQMYSADILRREPSSQMHKSGYTENASTIYALTAAIDAKDHYTFQHSQNVAYYASELAKAAGMTSDLVEIVREAGLLHDIGKIGIREEILNKPEKLTPDEFEIMKSHVESAVNIIRHLPSLDYVIPAVLSHHERYDGRGYPRKLAMDNIPITGRILCIADSFDAMTSTRNYKGAVPIKDAVVILRSESGKQFDPNLVEIFAELVESGKIELQNHLPAAPETAQPAPTEAAE